MDIIDSPPHTPFQTQAKQGEALKISGKEGYATVPPVFLQALASAFHAQIITSDLWQDKTMSAPASLLWLSDAPDSFPPTYSPQIITMLKGFVGHSCTISLATNQPVSVTGSRLLTPRVIIIFSFTLKDYISGGKLTVIEESIRCQHPVTHNNLFSLNKPRLVFPFTSYSISFK